MDAVKSLRSDQIALLKPTFRSNFTNIACISGFLLEVHATINLFVVSEHVMFLCVITRV